MLEEWKDIIGYEGLYQVSNYGNVRSVDRVWIGKTKLGEDRPCRLKGRILKPYLEKGKRSNIQPSVVYVLNRDNKRRNFYAPPKVRRFWRYIFYKKMKEETKTIRKKPS